MTPDKVVEAIKSEPLGSFILPHRILVLSLVGLLICYSRFISPFLGNNCRFTPNCSLYAAIALKRHGLFRGLYRTITRLLRCHPLNPGGEDPVPEKNGR